MSADGVDVVGNSTGRFSLPDGAVSEIVHFLGKPQWACIVDELTERMFRELSSGHYNPAGDLVDKGAKINAADRDGDRPLHIVAGRCQIKGIELLIDKGAKIDAANRRGETALHKAVDGVARNLGRPFEFDARRCVSMLIWLGANPTIPDLAGALPLDRAVAAGDTKTAQILQKAMDKAAGALANLPDAELQARKEHLRKAESLIEAELQRRSERGTRSRG